MKTIAFIPPDLRRLDASKTKVIVLFRFQELTPLRGVTSLLDWRLYGHLSRVMIEGFFKGELEETLLVPLGRQLAQDYMLLIGLGQRNAFGRNVFQACLNLAFYTVDKLKTRHMALSLPGRVEGLADAKDAIGWLIEVYGGSKEEQEIAVVEPPSAQKAMSPEVERWRLRQLVPYR